MNSLQRSWLLLLGTILVLNIVASQDEDTTEKPEVEAFKKEKSFSIFSVVNFQNVQCRSQDTSSSGSTANRNGTCFTSSECSSKGGIASGNCASGFGVCCLFKVSSVSSTISQNNTYVQNPSFPAVYTGTLTTLSYKVSKVSNNICWLRLDFETFAILGPSNSEEIGGGVCVDTFTITSPTKQRVPTICGSNAGQHMYLDFGTDLADTVSLNFALTGTATTRTWEIKTTQLECSNPNRPPAGCLQYFTTLIGRITSFNFADSATSHLASQDYSVCVKKQEGFCCVQYQACPDQTGSFSIDNLAAAGQSNDELCTSDYISIPGSNPVCSNANNGNLVNKYCGPGFGIARTSALPNNAVCDCTAPFNLFIHTNALSDTAANAANTVLSRGVCLDYTQLPCTNN